MADILVGRGVRRPAPTLFDLITGPATAAQSALGAMGSAAKGAAQATVGLPGDVESLVRLLTGGEQRLPTTEQVGQFVNQYIRSPYPQYERLGEFTGLPTAGALTRPTAQITNEAADALVRAITRNPEATAQRVIQETSMPFMQAVAPRMPSLLETPVKSDLGFYSALEQATLPLQNKGTGTQFLAQIEKTAGVKPEEVKWTGLDEFLKSRQNVTKQEVQDYLAANRVNLQEVQLGTLTPEQSELRNASLNRYRMLTDEIATARQMADEGSLSPEDARRYISRRTAERDQLDQTINQLNLSNTTKFSSYTLPGGENYREILLTLPAKQLSEAEARIVLNAAPDAKLSPADIAYASRKNVNEYKSSHFDQPNILAHMRVNDRVVDGKNTLFIEEIQSDWHQAGRKKGYSTPELKSKIDSLHAKLGSVLDESEPLLIRQREIEASNPSGFSTDPEWIAITDRRAVLSDTKTNLRKEIQSLEVGVPDAPFKTTWHELTLKRAIQEASEKGYDRIAFTTGKTQAERYDLSKQVKNINVESIPEAPGVQFIDVYTPEGKTIFMEIENGVIREGQYAGKRLDEVVGKDLAEKITSVPAGQKIKIEGEDLSIGGQGMKGFYDQILPKSLEKLGKKFDAKVGKTDMDGVEVWSMDITPKMRESVLTKGQPLFAATPAIPAAGLLGDEGE